MNTTGIGPAQPFQPISPFSPHSKPAVGLESSESKDQTLPPVEESSHSDRLRERLGQRVGAVGDDGDEASADDRSESQTPADEEPSQHHDDSPLPMPFHAALRPVATIDAGAEHSTAAPAKALDQFQQASQQPIPAGLLLDEKT